MSVGILLPVEQRTPEWLHARCGKLTASRMSDALAKLKKGGDSAARYDYKIEIVGERLTGRAQEKFVTADMQRGIDLEPVAREVYQIKSGNDVRLTGFFVHPLIEMSGASPDGLIGDDGLIEIKCPRVTTHLKWILTDVVPEEHAPQMMWQMDCTGRQWCDFVSYCPELPSGLDIWIKRLPRDEAKIKELRDEVTAFLAEVATIMEQLKGIQ